MVRVFPVHRRSGLPVLDRTRMPVRLSIFSLPRVLFRPRAVFEALAAAEPSAPRCFSASRYGSGCCRRFSPTSARCNFGWRLGVEPVFLPPRTVLAICATYFVLLLFGFLSSARDRALDGRRRMTRSVARPLPRAAYARRHAARGRQHRASLPARVHQCARARADSDLGMFLLYRGLPIVLETGPDAAC